MSDNHDLLNDKDVCSFEEHRQKMCVPTKMPLHVESVVLMQYCGK